MKAKSSAALLAALGGAGALSAAWRDRHLMVSWGLTAAEGRRPHRATAELGPNLIWFDDWFAVGHVDSMTIAIAEPRYYQRNVSYLVLGTEHALLFDTGPGIRSIREVADALTSLPITVLASHVHFDHIGGHRDFASVAVADVPEITGQMENDTFQPTIRQHLGWAEGHDRPVCHVAARYAPGDLIQLGSRILEVLHTPGHTPESISLFDRERRMVFTGDFLYRGNLLAALPGSDIVEYRTGAERLLDEVPNDVWLLGGHDSDNGPAIIPMLGRDDLGQLRETLTSIDPQGSSKFLPATHKINEEISLVAW